MVLNLAHAISLVVHRDFTAKKISLAEWIKPETFKNKFSSISRLFCLFKYFSVKMEHILLQHTGGGLPRQCDCVTEARPVLRF